MKREELFASLTRPPGGLTRLRAAARICGSTFAVVDVLLGRPSTSQ